MAIKSGRGNIRQKHWRNSHTNEVQKRIDSVLDPFRDRINNSLKVDSLEIIIYKRVRLGLPCSCSIYEDEGIVNLGDSPSIAQQVLTPSNKGRYADVEIKDVGTGMFGGKSNTIAVNDRIQPKVRSIELSMMVPEQTASSMLEEHADNGLDSSPLGNNENCGICLMQGVVPSYVPVGYTQFMFTHHHVEHASGYNLNRGFHPYLFEQFLDKGFVRFELNVPKHWTEVEYSIRNNLTMTSYHFYKDGALLTKAMLDAHRGKTIKLEVRAPSFTHAVISFNLGSNPIMANMSDEQNVINYDQELTVGDLNLVFPVSVGMMNPEDYIYIKKRNYVVKLNAVTKKRTANGQFWEWSVGSRTVQRKDAAFNIHRGFKLR